MTPLPIDEAPDASAPNEATASGRGMGSRQVLWLTLGFGVWSSALVVVYALHAVGCAFGWPATTIRLSLTLALVVHIALIGLLWRVQAAQQLDPASGRKSAFLHWVIVATLIAALANTVFSLGPVLFLTVCK